MATVLSGDATPLDVTVQGAGPVLVLVGGGLDDGSELAPLLPVLADSLTVVNYARRGRGASGDTAPYAVERELEDLAAVVAHAGGRAHVFAASSGGALALRFAAAHPSAVDRLAVFDVPYVLGELNAAWRDYVRALDAALAADDLDQALRLFMRLAGSPPEVVESAAASPAWPPLLGLAPTLAYDAACLGDGLPPVPLLASIAAPILVLTSASPDAAMSGLPDGFFAATASAAVPDARRGVVPMTGHAVDAAAVAPVLREFLLR